MAYRKLKEWIVCGTCLNFIQNDDATSLDYYHSQKESNRRFVIMKQSLACAGGFPIVTEPTFSQSFIETCDCCQSVSECVANVTIMAKVYEPKYEMIKHPVNQYLFKVRVWETPSMAIDLTPWIPKIDALRTMNEQFK